MDNESDVTVEGESVGNDVPDQIEYESVDVDSYFSDSEPEQKQPEQAEKPKAKSEETEEPKTEKDKETTEESEEDNSLLGSWKKAKEGEGKSEESEEAPEDKLELHESASEQSREGWKTLKGIAKEVRSENAILKKELEEIKAGNYVNPELQGKLDALEKEKQQLLDIVAKKDLSSHPKFQEEFETPLNSAVSRISEVLQDQESDLSIDKIMKADKKQLSDMVDDITEGMPKLYAREFLDDVMKARELNEKKIQALENASEFQQQIQTQSKTEALNTFSTTANSYKNEFGFLLSPLKASEDATPDAKHEADTYNQRLAVIEANAQKKMFEPLPLADQSKAMLKAEVHDFLVDVGLPRIEKEYTALAETNRQLVAEIQKLKGKKPAPQGKVMQKESSDGSFDIDKALEEAYA